MRALVGCGRECRVVVENGTWRKSEEEAREEGMVVEGDRRIALSLQWSREYWLNLGEAFLAK